MATATPPRAIPHIKPFRHPRARFRHTRHPACDTIAAEPFFAFSSKTRNRSAGRPSRATPRPASPEKHTSLVSDFAGCSQNMVYAHFGVTSHVGALGCLLPICRLDPRQVEHRTRRLQSGGLRGAFLPGFRKTLAKRDVAALTSVHIGRVCCVLECISS